VTRRRYSREVKLIGYCIIAFEALAVFTWGGAFYSNVGTLASTAMSMGSGGGSGAGFTNTTTEAVLTVPIKGAGLFPVSVSATATIMNSQNQTMDRVSGNVTVSPGETRNLIFQIPLSLLNSTSFKSETIRVSLDVSSIYGMVGMKAQADLSPGEMGGNST